MSYSKNTRFTYFSPSGEMLNYWYVMSVRRWSDRGVSNEFDHILENKDKSRQYVLSDEFLTDSVPSKKGEHTRFMTDEEFEEYSQRDSSNN